MANEIIPLPRNLSSEGLQKEEGQPPPAEEFVYTGNLWRLTRGTKTRKISPDPKRMRSYH